MESKQDEKQLPDAKDGRLKIPLRKAAPRILELKQEFERVEGRDLTWDEVLMMMAGYVEITTPDAISTRAHKMLKELGTYLADHKEDSAAQCVELFREALIDVLRGRMEARRLEGALIDA